MLKIPESNAGDSFLFAVSVSSAGLSWKAAVSLVNSFNLLLIIGSGI
jgi:hypothetical protein